MRLLLVDNGPRQVRRANVRRRRNAGERHERARKRHGEHASDLNETTIIHLAQHSALAGLVPELRKEELAEFGVASG